MDWLTLWFIFSIAVAVIASLLGRSGIGWFVLSLLISPLLAVIVLAIAGRAADADAPKPDTHVKCPDCAELVRKEARVCKHCGCRLVPQP
jgi:hypothetical protein